nr:ABC transporter ATP-binding protein [Saprospiraceae bacterium]
MIQTEGLTFSYKNGDIMEFPDIDCKAGETHLILGPSGCGKTTLLHLMGGMMKPNKGKVNINNIDIVTLSGARRDKFRGQHIGLVFQQPHFVESLSVSENLKLAQRLAGQPVSESKVDEILEQLGVKNKKNKKPTELSAGEQQRVTIARAAINRPAVLLADEPTSALDDQNCRSVVELLEKMAKQNGSALVVVTHDHRLTDFFPNKTILHQI